MPIKLDLSLHVVYMVVIELFINFRTFENHVSAMHQSTHNPSSTEAVIVTRSEKSQLPRTQQQDTLFTIKQ